MNGGAARPSAWGSGFQLAHTIGEQPQGAVQAHGLVDALHGARALAASVGAAAYQSALRQVLLRAVEHAPQVGRSEEHTSELQPLMRISYAVFRLKKKKRSKPLK